MATLCTLLPARRPDLRLTPLGEDGQGVVKDPRSGEFFHLGPEEHFLLSQLDGRLTAGAVCAAFEARFGEPLGEDGLAEFVELARAQGWLATDPTAPAAASEPALPRQSILYWRKRLFDPDRLMTWLAPRLGLFWSRGFLIASAAAAVLAAAVLLLNSGELLRAAAAAIRLETAVWAWVVMGVATTLHEFAHGLTCKRHGGEVHEIGFLMLFFMPCFYCNVSDAWLFKEKSKRLAVTLAGGWCDLCVWAAAVLVWRLTLPGTAVNYLALVTLSVTGVRALFNFNPLIKLDGYYLLSDWLEAPNLHQRGQDHFKARLRSQLWGAAPPEPDPRGKLLWRYGAASWLYSLVFLGLALWGLFALIGTGWGLAGAAAVTLLAVLGLSILFRGVFAGEVRKMILHRRKRTLIWLAILAALAGVLCLPVEDRAGGTFQVRPAVRAELRAEVAGFVRDVSYDEGAWVSPGAVVARLEVPDLETRISQKRAEVKEAEARLRLLEAGARPEEVAEQRCRVERAQKWGELARQDVEKARQALHEELTRLDKQIAQAQVEADFAREAHDRSKGLLARRATSAEQCREAETRSQVCAARLAQAEAEKAARQARGAAEAEMELARREKELADARGALKLLEAGSRPEEVEAEHARLARLRTEADYLTGLPGRLLVRSAVPGVITTARLRERVGQYVREGEVICVVEEPSSLEVEITLSEQEVARVRPGQEIGLKARALPYDGLSGRVERVAPAAVRGQEQGTFTVYGRLDGAPAELRPGMSGYARVYTGRRAIGAILADRVLRFVRTEFWW